MKNFRTFNHAVSFYRAARALELPAHLRDQLSRAASSIALNCAEARGKDSLKDQLRFFRIAMGSVGTTPIRAKEAEAVLRGQPVKGDAIREAAEKAKQAVDPISDFRGSAAYKKEMAGVFVRRALEKALESLTARKPKPKQTRPTPRRRKK